MNTISIRSYHQRHPQVTAVPSLSQSGGLSAVLRRIDQKQLRRERRRALLRKAVAWTTRRAAALGHNLRRLLASRPSTAGNLFHPRSS